MKERPLVIAALVAGCGACTVGAVGTAVWMARHGLTAPRADLSVAQTTLRILLLAAALTLVPSRRSRVERLALSCGAIGAGCSAIFGLGVRGPAVSSLRLIFHLLFYALGAFIMGRALMASGSHASRTETGAPEA